MAGRRDKGEGSVYQRSDTGKWIARIEIDGKRVTRSAATRREANRLLAVMRRKLEEPDVPPSEQPFADWCDEWLENRTPDLAYNTKRRQERHIAVFKAEFPRYRLSDLTAADIQRFLTRLRTRVQPSTARGYYADLRLILEDAVRFDLLPSNPCTRVTPPSGPHREVQHLTREDLARLLTATEGERYHPLWVVMAATGLRVGEVTALTWEDIDETAKTLTVKAAMVYQAGVGLVRSAPKSASSVRSVPLIPDVLRALQARRVASLEERLAAGPLWQDHGLVFSSPTGAPLYNAAINRAWHAATEKAGLPTSKPHVLRHTCGTLLLEAGTPLTFVQRVLGHSSATITLGVYSHHSEERAHEFMERLSESLAEARRRSGA